MGKPRIKSFEIKCPKCKENILMRSRDDEYIFSHCDIRANINTYGDKTYFITTYNNNKKINSVYAGGKAFVFYDCDGCPIGRINNENFDCSPNNIFNILINKFDNILIYA